MYTPFLTPQHIPLFLSTTVPVGNGNARHAGVGEKMTDKCFTKCTGKSGNRLESKVKRGGGQKRERRKEGAK